MSWRLRLTLGYAMIFAVTVLLGAAGVYLASRVILSASLDTTLSETASVARASIERPGGPPRLSASLRPSGDVFIELLAGSGQALDEAGQRADRVALPLRAGFASAGERRVLTSRMPGGLWLRVSRPSDTLSGLLEVLARILVAGALGMVLLACGAGYWLAGRALRPVGVVAQTAREIAQRGSYRDRVPASPGQDEMAQLSATVNGMLDRLESTIEREKTFARTAAHELRTPLTALRGRLDLALDKPRDAAGYRTALRSMQARVEALIGLSEGLLRLAQTDVPPDLVQVELAGLALEAAEDCAEQVARAGRRLHLDVEEHWVRAEAAGVRQVVTNLLENALKYGGGEVVHLRVRAGQLSVSDAGPGPDEQAWARLLQPFERGAGVQGLPGSGLGLALVDALAERWSARLRPVWSPGAFTVQLEWPPDEG